MHELYSDWSTDRTYVIRIFDNNGFLVIRKDTANGEEFLPFTGTLEECIDYLYKNID